MMKLCGMITAAVMPLFLMAAETPEIPEFHRTVNQYLVHGRWSPGPSVADREAWGKIAASPVMSSVLTAAKALVTEAVKAPDESLYPALAGDRSSMYDQYEASVTRLRQELGTVFLAYCCTLEEVYLDAVVQRLGILAGLRSWTKPSSDRDLGNFNGTAPTIDLRSSRLAWQLAIVLDKLRDRLPENLKNQLEKELRRRIIRIYRDTITHQVRFHYTQQNDNYYWLKARNNWNAVCLAGVIGVILAVEEDPAERSMLVARALDYSENYLRGYPSDGYCSEGPSYWTYGFKHYLFIALMLQETTGGHLNLMERPEAAAPATYPDRIRVTESYFPALADCPYGAGVKASLLALRDAFSARPSYWKRSLNAFSPKEFHEFLLTVRYLDFPRESMPESPETLPEQTLFPDGGIAVLRPTGTGRLAALFKGGSNHEVHNHNDVGSFHLLLDGVPMIIDPGSEVYSGRTFGSRRYESRVINSFGHSVPRVGGALQVAGEWTDARTLECQGPDGGDFRWRLDLTPAYRLTSLQKLERTFEFLRAGEGEVVVSDRVEFSRPEIYEFAWITTADWRRTGPKTLLLEKNGVQLEAVIECAVPWWIAAEPLGEKLPVKLDPVRVSLTAEHPVSTLNFRVRFRPVSASKPLSKKE